MRGLPIVLVTTPMRPYWFAAAGVEYSSYAHACAEPVHVAFPVGVETEGTFPGVYGAV